MEKESIPRVAIHNMESAMSGTEFAIELQISRANIMKQVGHNGRQKAPTRSM
jgi:hypothetical protein